MKYVLIAGILIAAGFVIALQFIPIGIEPLTELYFENHTSLPKFLFLGRDYNYTFTIRNLEYRNMSYGYNATAIYGNQSSWIGGGSVEIADNESAGIFQSFKFDRGFERAMIKTEIYKNGNYSDYIDIHFWVEEIKGPTITIIPD